MEPIVSPPRRQDRQEDAKEGIEPSAELDLVARQIVDGALSVHRALGPGLLEAVYEKCLAYELEQRGLSVARQMIAPLRYRDLFIETGFRMDLVVNASIIVEIKSVERLMPIHEAQLLTYLKFSGCRLGLLLNFNVLRLKDGIKRLIFSP